MVILHRAGEAPLAQLGTERGQPDPEAEDERVENELRPSVSGGVTG
jgi:hypothetical protein